MGIELSRRGVLAAGAATLAAPQLLVASPAGAQDAATATAALVYPRKVGELRADRDQRRLYRRDRPVFANIDEDDVSAARTAAFLDPAAPFRIGVTAHLVRGGDRTVLIDTGTADLFGPTLGRLAPALAALGVAPELVDAVLVTHMHPDHIGGLLAGGAPAFPNATLHVNETDLAFWTDEATAGNAPDQMKPFFDWSAEKARAYADRVIPFGADAEVLPGITSVALPGTRSGTAAFASPLATRRSSSSAYRRPTPRQSSSPTRRRPSSSTPTPPRRWRRA